MSENGPREGTRDLPRRDPESGQRSAGPDSLAGAAYDALDREQRRRRQALWELAAEELSDDEIAERYGRDHPFERPVTRQEIRTATEPTGSNAGGSPRRRPG